MRSIILPIWHMKVVAYSLLDHGKLLVNISMAQDSGDILIFGDFSADERRKFFGPLSSGVEVGCVCC